MSAPSALRPEDIIRRIGDTNEAALRYVLAPDPKLGRLSRKLRDVLLPELPPVTAGALLGPEALARHFVASASGGRYRDLFALWDLFRQRPEQVRPVLAERQEALNKGRTALSTATVLGLRGHAERVAEDIARAEGLIWQWLREILADHLEDVGARPSIAVSVLEREPDLEVPLPDEPDERWLEEAAAVRLRGPLPDQIDKRFAAGLHRLTPSVALLGLAHDAYPDQLPALLERVDLDDAGSGQVLAWARDHGVAGRLHERAAARVEELSATDRGEGARRWHEWLERGVDLPLPDALRAQTLEGLDLTRPEAAVLVGRLQADGASFELQGELEAIAGRNRQLAEKAYEAMVCAGLDVTLPPALEDNPIVKEGTRCPRCRAWTWVRPGHEQRCPRPLPEAEPAPSGADDLAAEWTVPDEQPPPPPPPTPDATADDQPPAATPDEQPPSPTPDEQPPSPTPDDQPPAATPDEQPPSPTPDPTADEQPSPPPPPPTPDATAVVTDGP